MKPSWRALRREGDDHAANLFEVAAQALTLLITGRFTEHDVLATELVERYRLHGPPTCLHWALTMLASSASVQGRHQESWDLYEKAVAVDVADRTHSLSNPMQARAALRRGDRRRAFEILGSYIEELLDNDNMYVAKVTCVEFVAMMVRVDRPREAARVLGFLEATGFLDVPAFKSLLTADVRRIRVGSDSNTAHERSLGEDFDDRSALAYMREVLDRLVHEVHG